MVTAMPLTKKGFSEIATEWVYNIYGPYYNIYSVICNQQEKLSESYLIG